MRILLILTALLCSLHAADNAAPVLQDVLHSPDIGVLGRLSEQDKTIFTPKVADARKAFQDAEAQYIRELSSAIESLKLAEIPVPKLPADPRKSDEAAYGAAIAFNRDIITTRDYYTERLKKIPHESGRLDLVQAVRLAARQRQLIEMGVIKKEADETLSQKPRDKPKIKATLADGTVIEQ